MGFLFGSNLDMGGGFGFGGSGNALPRSVTDYFNGFELSGSTYSGGPTVVADNTGALVTSPADVLPIEGMRLATTVAEGATLGPELAPQSLTLWGDGPNLTEKTPTSFTTATTGGVRYDADPPTVGKRYRFLLQGTTTANELSIKDYGNTQTHATHSGGGTFNLSVESIAAGTGYYLRHVGAGMTTITQVSVREVIPQWLPTDLSGDPIHASTPLRTTKGTVQKYAESYKGPLIEPARTNKVTCRKENPTDTSNITKEGDAAAVLSVVDDAAALAAARLEKVCTSGKVYKLDNSAGSTHATARIAGETGNINTHAAFAYARGGGGAYCGIRINGTAGAETLISSDGYARYESIQTPTATTRKARIDASPGKIVYFILPQLEEGAFLTSPICKASDGSDPLTSLTRPAANLTRPTAGTALAALNNWAILIRFRPTAAGQTAVLWGSYTDANNATQIDLAPTTLTFKKRLEGVDYTAQASLTHAADTLYEALIYQHSVHGMGIRVRSWNGSVWSAWSAWATNANTQNAPIASTYQIGARNNANHFAANYPFTEIIRLNPSLHPQTQLADLLAKGRI